LKLRSHLLLLATVAVLPIVIFSAVVSSLLVERERDTVRRAAMERTRALMTAMDAELRGSIATLQALGSSKALLTGDLGAFHAETVRVLASQPHWRNVNLYDAAGRKLWNARERVGAPQPGADVEAIRRTVLTRRPTIGALRFGAVIRQYAVPVSVPVLRKGAVAYVITAFVDPALFTEILHVQRLPPGWAMAVADAKKQFVARIPPRPLGDVASPAFSTALDSGMEGMFYGATVEGKASYQSYSRSAFSGWGVGIAIPAEALDGIAWRAGGLMAVGGAVSLALAFALALFLSRRVAVPIASLAAGAHALGRGENVSIEERERVMEVGTVATALAQAASAVRNREETLRIAENALRVANRSKDEFLATLSHELRNPLAAIVMSSHLLRMSGDRPEITKQATDVIERQSAQMLRLIEDLLDISRITMGKLSVDRKPLDLAQAARQVVVTWRATGRFDAHEIAIDTAPAWIEGDPARIEQIVSNLLDNAVKFTPRGGRIDLRVSQADTLAVLEVRDNGHGLPKELGDRVFDVFVQGEQTLDRPSGGLGIGLSLVKRLAELHGGSAEARNDPGKGAIFIVRFPAVAPQLFEAGARPRAA
jgi:signal transduction histidine kinase